MPSFTHGKKTKVLINEAEFTQYFKEYSAGVSMDTAETSAFGSEVKTYVQGMSAGTLSLSGMFDGSAGAVDQELSESIGATSESVITIAPTGSFAIGKRVVSGVAWQGSYQISGSVGDIVGVSAEFAGSGGFQSGVSLADLTSAIGVTTTNTAVDNTVSTAKGAVLGLHLFPNTFNHATTIKVEHSADNVTFATLATFDAVAAGATSAQHRIVPTGTTINRYVRAVATLATSATAASGTVSYTVSLVRL